MIHVLVYFQGLKRKPITCKNKWRVLYPNWVNAEIHSFDWFTFLTSKCLASEWGTKALEANSKSFFEPPKMSQNVLNFST